MESARAHRAKANAYHPSPGVTACILLSKMMQNAGGGGGGEPLHPTLVKGFKGRNPTTCTYLSLFQMDLRAETCCMVTKN